MKNVYLWCLVNNLLKTFAKLLKPEQGSILLDGKSIFSIPSKQMAQTLGLLPQSPIVPEGIKVTDLVARGRFPYRKLMGGLQKEDFAAVEEALEMMGTTILMVLHDINLSARYADHIFAMSKGKLIAQGRPSEVISQI